MRSNSLSMKFVRTVTNLARIVGFISLSNSCAFELMNRFRAASAKEHSLRICHWSTTASLTNDWVSVGDIVHPHSDVPYAKVHFDRLDVHKGETLLGRLWRGLEVHLCFHTLCNWIVLERNGHPTDTNSLFTHRTRPSTLPLLLPGPR